MSRKYTLCLDSKIKCKHALKKAKCRKDLKLTKELANSYVGPWGQVQMKYKNEVTHVRM
jgi:cytochrome c551/c552